MVEKYSSELISKMNIGEISILIGHDYLEFRKAGGTNDDLYQVINGYKTLQEVVGFPPMTAPRTLSEETLQEIQQRGGLPPWVWGFISIFAVAISCYVSTALNAPAPFTFAPVILTLLVILVYRLRSRRR